MACADGTYNSLIGQGSCEACPSGAYCTKTDKYYCQPGTFSKGGALKCDDCPIGQYQTNKGESKCIDCEKGTYNLLEGQEKCQDCPGGFSCDDPKSCPSACPAGKYTRSIGKCSSCKKCKVEAVKECSGCKVNTEFSCTNPLAALFLQLEE
jgi:hypothetical protein